MTKLTQDILYEIGFRGEGRDHINKPAYRLEIPNFHSYEIQIVLANYSGNNPNNGIVSLYQREMKDVHCLDSTYSNPNKKLDYIIQKNIEDGGKKYNLGIKYVTFKENVQPIAWGVTTFERLRDIIKALTNHTITLKTKQNGNSSTIKRINRTTRKK